MDKRIIAWGVLIITFVISMVIEANGTYGNPPSENPIFIIDSLIMIGSALYLIATRGKSANK